MPGWFDYVRCSRKTGSSRRTAKPTRLTQKSHVRLGFGGDIRPPLRFAREGRCDDAARRTSSADQGLEIGNDEEGPAKKEARRGDVRTILCFAGNVPWALVPRRRLCACSVRFSSRQRARIPNRQAYGREGRLPCVPRRRAGEQAAGNGDVPKVPWRNLRKTRRYDPIGPTKSARITPRTDLLFGVPSRPFAIADVLQQLPQLRSDHAVSAPGLFLRPHFLQICEFSAAAFLPAI